MTIEVKVCSNRSKYFSSEHLSGKGISIPESGFEDNFFTKHI